MELLTDAWALLVQFFDVITHLDVHLNEWIRMFGPWIYAILFLIIFCETGLVITPFLPGDSLLFALGALSVGTDAALNYPTLFVLLVVAGILGDAVNYSIGRRIGPRIFSSSNSKIFNKSHLLKTQEFYEKYGGKTVILARFLPIFRTFAPFVAGIGTMNYSRFAMYNVVGAFAWVGTFLTAGYFFGNLPIVKRNFHFVILAIIVISAIPPVMEWIKYRRERRAHV